MNQRYRPAQRLLAGIALFGSLAVAGAQELPPRQPGLWKQTQYEGKDAQTAEVIYQCVDEASDEKFRAMAKKMASCTEEPVKRKGNTMVGRNVCQVMGSRVTTEYVISGNMKTEFRIDSRSTHEPPLFGQAQSETVILAEWQGPCKPGQKPGDMIIEEDGETGTLSMEDLENLQGMSKALEHMQSMEGMGQMLEQLQKMQSQGGGTGVDMQELGKMMEQLQQMQKLQQK